MDNMKREEYRTLFISDTRYPEGNDASTIRFTNIIRLFQLCGCKAEVVAYGDSTGFSFREKDGIRYISLRSKNQSIPVRICDRQLFACRVKKHLNRYRHLSRIVVYNIPNSLMVYLKKYTQKKGIDLIYDCVEWYSKEEFSLGVFDPRYRAKNKLITKIVDKNIKVIAISRYLQKYFESKGVTTIRIPVLIDSVEESIPKERNGHIRVVYAGSPGRKDSLDKIIEGFRLLPDAYHDRIKLYLYGVDYKWIKKNYGYTDSQIREMKRYVKAFGRKSNDEVVRALGNADFSVLLRPSNLRYAKAGFPTKVVESLKYGAPVICNLTSDLGNYLTNNKNAIVVSGCNEDALMDSLTSVCNMADNRIIAMHKEARSLGRQFILCNYVDGIGSLLLNEEKL